MRPGSSRRILVPVLLSSALVVVLLAVLGVAWVYRKARAVQQVAATLPAERQKAKEAGLPFRSEDLVRKPPVPDADNAAPIYKRITQDLTAKPLPKEKEKTALLLLKGEGTPEQRQAAKELLQIAAPQMRLAEEAVKKPECDFQRDWSQGADLKFPEYAKIRQLARLYAVQAVLLSNANDITSAFRSLGIIGKMAQHTGKDTTLIAMLVQIALEAIADTQWVQILKKQGYRSEVRQASRELENAFGPLPNLKHAMWGDFVMTREITEKLGNTSPKGQFVSDAFEVRILQYHRKVLAALDETRTDPLGCYFRLKSLSEAEEANPVQNPDELLNTFLTPVYPPAALRLVQMQTTRNLRKTLLLLMEHRLQHGKFPTALAELEKPAPPDTFTGKSLLYRPANDGFLLYSVGQNFTDDGGSILKNEDEKFPKDIGIVYP